ncbi:unnamed protein product, partial [marine sediment metagenome]
PGRGILSGESELGSVKGASYHRNSSYILLLSYRDDNGVLNFPRNEWAKAETEKEAYFVYIYTGLRADGSPERWEIRNLTKYLDPDVPEDKRVSDWRHAVARRTTFKKV